MNNKKGCPAGSKKEGDLCVLKPKGAKFALWNSECGDSRERFNEWIFYDENKKEITRKCSRLKPSEDITLISPMTYYGWMKRKEAIPKKTPLTIADKKAALKEEIKQMTTIELLRKKIRAYDKLTTDLKYLEHGQKNKEQEDIDYILKKRKLPRAKDAVDKYYNQLTADPKFKMETTKDGFMLKYKGDFVTLTKRVDTDE